MHARFHRWIVRFDELASLPAQGRVFHPGDTAVGAEVARDRGTDGRGPDAGVGIVGKRHVECPVILVPCTPAKTGVQMKNAVCEIAIWS